MVGGPHDSPQWGRRARYIVPGGGRIRELSTDVYNPVEIYIPSGKRTRPQVSTHLPSSLRSAVVSGMDCASAVAEVARQQSTGLALDAPRAALQSVFHGKRSEGRPRLYGGGGRGATRRLTECEGRQPLTLDLLE